MWRSAILQMAEKSLLDEKASKLLGLARTLDQLLGGGFQTWLTLAGASPDAEGPERIQALNLALSPMVGGLAAAFPGVGLGFFDAVSGRVVTYAPSETLGHLVGAELTPDHLGWSAMKERVDKVAVGTMVRGDALNSVHPIIRQDEVLGFTFASESLEDIYRQLQSVGPRVGGLAGEQTAALGLSSLAVFAGSAALNADQLRNRLLAAIPAASLPEEQVCVLIHQLQQVDRYARLILQNMGTGVLIVGESDRVEFVNRPLQELTGVNPESLVGQHWTEAMAALGVPAADTGPLGEPSRAPRFVYSQLHTAKGETVPVALMVSGLPGDEEHSSGRVFLFEDTRRSQQASEYFVRAERLALAGQLAAAIAHEIRNPITIVAGSAQLIPQRLHDEAFLTSFAEIAGQELSRVNRIIQGMLGFARYSEPDRRPVDLGEVIARAVEFSNWYAEKRGVQIVTQVAGQYMVRADAEHLHQALLNLIINGVQAMPDGGTLTVRMDHPTRSRFVRIQVEDQGMGMEPEQLERVWDVFYSTKAGGTGLGLPVVQRIVDEHRGYVEVDSAPGKGTRFSILLPLITSTRTNRKNGQAQDAHGLAQVRT